MNHVQIGLHETGVAAADYPLLFMKDIESGQFRLVALFGLRPAENLFLVNNQWQATYLPLAVLGAPFYLVGQERSLCIDENSDLVTTDTGAALYSSDGGETGELSRVRSMLEYLRDDLDASNAFISVIVDQSLIRPLSVTVHFGCGDSEHVEGLYSINPSSLLSLDDTVISDLHRRKFLDKIYIIINSLSQVNRIHQLFNLRSEQKISRLVTEMDLN